MAESEKPRLDLAERILPPGLLTAFRHVSQRSGSDTMLVGGTALAGFYAGHRRSDDLDLFCAHDAAFQATTGAVNLLPDLGATLSDRFTSGTYQRAVVNFQGHTFTTDVVLDQNIFRVGKRLLVGDNMGVASLDTLLKMKSATLVSRCSEKDLYDLLWLFGRFPKLTLSAFLAAGQEVDGGVNGETMVFSLASSKLSESACHFAINESATQAYANIVAFRDELLKQLSLMMHSRTAATPLADLVRWVKKVGLS